VKDAFAPKARQYKRNVTCLCYSQSKIKNNW